MSARGFAARYGPWALVAGASEGIGASIAQKLAERNVDLVLVARRAEPLEDLAERLRRSYRVKVIPQVADLGSSRVIPELHAATASLDVGLLVYNAAHAPISAYLDLDVQEHLRTVDVNVRGPLRLSHYFGRRLVERGKGGIVLLSSIVGLQGTARLANYAATKAYNTILAEGLWYELRDRGVDVLACVAGPTLTPGYRSSTGGASGHAIARPMNPDDVAEQALRQLGRRPSGIAGRLNQIASALLCRVLPREAAIQIVSKETERMFR